MSKPLKVEPIRSRGCCIEPNVLDTSRHLQAPRARQPSRARHPPLPEKVQIVFVQSYFTKALAREDVATAPRSSTLTRSFTEVKFSSRRNDAEGRLDGFLMDAAFSALTAVSYTHLTLPTILLV